MLCTQNQSLSKSNIQNYKEPPTDMNFHKWVILWSNIVGANLKYRVKLTRLISSTLQTWMQIFSNIYIDSKTALTVQASSKIVKFMSTSLSGWRGGGIP